MDDFMEAFHPVVHIAGWAMIGSVLVFVVLGIVGMIATAVGSANTERILSEQDEQARQALLEWEASDRG